MKKLNIIGINQIDSKFYTVYPASDVIKIDLIIKQDVGLQVFISPSIFQKLIMLWNILPYPF